jgi:hypothetical protein
MRDKERGGTALQDPALGINMQDWECYLDGAGYIVVQTGATATQLYHAPAARELTVAFDQNMNPIVAWMDGNVLRYRWYDPVPEDYSVDTIPGGRSPFLTHDDKRDESVQIGTTDILFFYIKGSTLCYRQQRDRYGVERVLATFHGPRLWIRRCGMNEEMRIQVEVLGSDAKLAA